MKEIFEDENNTTEFDFTKAVRVFEPHILASKHPDYVSDVDFVIESEDAILFLEYKNGKLKGTSNPVAFSNKISDGSLANSLVKKFFGTLFIVMITEINLSKKPIRYYCVIETREGSDNVEVKKLRNKVFSKLPFDYSSNPQVHFPIIEKFELLDISRWNALFKQYPITVKEECLR